MRGVAFATRRLDLRLLKKKEERNRLIIDLYLKCYPEKEISERLEENDVSLDRSQVNRIIEDSEIFSEFTKTHIDNPAHSNAWKPFNLERS